MPDQTAVIRTLKRAAQISGGAEALADRLGVPLSDVLRWIAGTAPQPGFLVFIEVLDIVAAGQGGMNDRRRPAA